MLLPRRLRVAFDCHHIVALGVRDFYRSHVLHRSPPAAPVGLAAAAAAAAAVAAAAAAVVGSQMRAHSTTLPVIHVRRVLPDIDWSHR